MKFLEEVVGKNYLNKKQFSQQLRTKGRYSSVNTSISFGGTKKNENVSVQVLQYQDQKLKLIGNFEGQAYKKATH